MSLINRHDEAVGKSRGRGTRIRLKKRCWDEDDCVTYVEQGAIVSLCPSVSLPGQAGHTTEAKLVSTEGRASVIGGRVLGAFDVGVTGSIWST